MRCSLPPGVEASIDREWAARRRAPQCPTRSNGRRFQDDRHLSHSHIGVIHNCLPGGRGFGFITCAELVRPVFFCAAWVSQSDGMSFDLFREGDRVMFNLGFDEFGRPCGRDVTLIQEN